MFNVMQMAEITESTEVDFDRSCEDTKSLCFLFLKFISAFFSGTIKSIFSVLFKKEAWKYAISVISVISVIWFGGL